MRKIRGVRLKFGKRSISLLAAALSTMLVLGAGVGIVDATTPSTSTLASGESLAVTCNGSHLSAERQSGTSYDLTCKSEDGTGGTLVPSSSSPPSSSEAPPSSSAAPPSSAPPSSTAAPGLSTVTTSASTWVPGTGNIEWQWELDHPLDVTSATDMGIGDSTYTGAASPEPTVYDIDGFDNPATTVAALHALGDHVICYIDVGTAENWRPDYSEFPAALLGSNNGWPGENWLNISPSGPDYSTLQSIMLARFQMCKSKGFDAVEPDNMDGAENSTGFPLTIAEQNTYDEWVANTVHSLGMSVAQKNYEDQSATLEPYFDFVIEEQCFQYNDCSDLAPYSKAGKAIFEVEYIGGAAPAESSFCPTANADNYNSVLFDNNLDGQTRIPCR